MGDYQHPLPAKQNHPVRVYQPQNRKGETMPKRINEKPVVYQLKVTLKNSKPPIWRRIQVAGDTSLAKLHWILQCVMEWTNSHLHQFKVGREYYGEPMPEEDFDVEDERKITLAEAAPGLKKKFIYEYDLGDGWEHEVVVEKILEPEPGVRYPFCVDGRRSRPPEDCGGIWGYEEFLEAIRDPKHPEHDSMLEWIGGKFDAEEFLEAIRDPKHPEHDSMLEWIGGKFDAEEFHLDFVNQELKHLK